jgi:hypothetical protein
MISFSDAEFVAQIESILDGTNDTLETTIQWSLPLPGNTELYCEVGSVIHEFGFRSTPCDSTSDFAWMLDSQACIVFTTSEMQSLVKWTTTDSLWFQILLVMTNFASLEDLESCTLDRDEKLIEFLKRFNLGRYVTDGGEISFEPLEGRTLMTIRTHYPGDRFPWVQFRLFLGNLLAT